MVNRDKKKKAIKLLKGATGICRDKIEILQSKSIELLEVRKKSEETIIISLEKFINELENRPNNLEKLFSQYKKEYKIFVNENKKEYKMFESEINQLKMNLKDIENTVKKMPKDITTPFSSIIKFMTSVKELQSYDIGSEGYLNEKCIVEEEIKKVEIKSDEIDSLITSNFDHIRGLEENLTILRMYSPKNYEDFSETQKKMLLTIISHIEYLLISLNKKMKS